MSQPPLDRASSIEPPAPNANEPLGPAGRVAAFFIDSKLTPLLVVGALVLGALATALTPREEEPQIVVPLVDLFVGLPGSSPAEVESRVTVPLERSMWRIPGVEYVYSTSLPDMAVVTVRFYVGDDQERSLVAVYDQLAGHLDAMPPTATPPLVRSRKIDDVPVLGLTLWSDAGKGPSSGQYDSNELRRIAHELAREVSTLENVAEAKIHGGQPRQVRVRLDPRRLDAAGLDPADVADALRMQNASAPAGAFEAGNREILVETGAFLRSLEEVASLVVGVSGGAGRQGSADGAASVGGGPIYLRDVATVEDDAAETRSYVFYQPGTAADRSRSLAGSQTQAAGSRTGAAIPRGLGGPTPAVTLTFAKRQGADAHRVAEAALARIEALRGDLLPRDVHVTITRDYGATAAEKASELLLHLTLAILTVTVVIGFFLGWRGALVVFVSVPVSFALTLFVYYVFGYTLNRVTLFALIFVTGIVVDDSIIVVENIVRHLSMRRGKPLEAALRAVSEVGNPTILATLTVIASVLPMAFVRGLMGPYMRPMPVGASLAMAFSLMVALIAAPWFAYRLFRGGRDERSERGEDRASGRGADDPDLDLDLDPGVDVVAAERAHLHASRTYRTYRRWLGPLLDSRAKAWLVLGITTLLLLASVLLVPLGKVSLKMLPFDNKSELQVILDLPEGTTLESTARVARDVAERLAREREVTDLQVYVGTSAPINFNGLVRHYDLRAGSNVADIQVNFLHKDFREDQSHDIAKRLRPLVQEVIAGHPEAIRAAAKVVEVPPGPPVLSTLVTEIYGPSAAERRRVAEEVMRVHAETPGVVDLDWSEEAPQPKKLFRVDREKAALHGVPAASVVRALRLALSGEDAGVLHLDDEVEPVLLRLELAREDRSSVDDLGAIRLRTRTGGTIALAELVRVEDSVRQPARHRKNLKPVSYVTADVAGEAESPTYAILDMSERLEQLRLPTGQALAQHWTDEPDDTGLASIKWDGEWHITYEVFRDLGAAFGAVLILIYFLIVGWFGSFRVPLVMMIAIPLTLVGIMPGHWLFGAFFTATSMIGFIALAGIMVRNSVLLIDFIDLAVARGASPREAVIEAGSVRLRPILLTAGTVVAGAIVILFDPIFQGLAIALMFGALASTGLTLVVVPLVYYMMVSDKGDGAETRSASQPIPDLADDSEPPHDDARPAGAGSSVG